MISATIKSVQECNAIKTNWNDLITTDKHSIDNTGICATYEWTKTLADIHLKDKEHGVIICKKKQYHLSHISILHYGPEKIWH